MINQATSCKSGRRRRLRGVRLASLLRLRVRLFGLAGLLVRCLEELKCRPRRWSPARASKPIHGGRCRRPRPAERESSFYSDAIADCLEFIKRSYLPEKDDTRIIG